jgi:hypothetical protein
MLLLPERAHAEQLMNSHFLSGMGCGDFTLLEDVTPERVRVFLQGIDQFIPSLSAVAGQMDGMPEVVRVIEQRLLNPPATKSAAVESEASR